jgi:hypothetical protein
LDAQIHVRVPLRSYPFLEIARSHDVDYGDVLLYAEWVKNRPASGPLRIPDEIVGIVRRLRSEVLNAVGKMMSRPIGDRHTPYIEDMH